jgi:catechol 2,3-dioxygenase-like lactoylglutathione lyase family enzyme
MLGESNVVATIAVNDLMAAKDFYSNTLGLKQLEDDPGVVTYQSGNGRLFVYESPTAGSGKASCATWETADIESIVNGLKEKGVTFEHYDMPGATVENDIHVMGPMKAAWFKDPDGNVLALVSG